MVLHWADAPGFIVCQELSPAYYPQKFTLSQVHNIPTRQVLRVKKFPNSRANKYK